MMDVVERRERLVCWSRVQIKREELLRTTLFKNCSTASSIDEILVITSLDLLRAGNTGFINTESLNLNLLGIA